MKHEREREREREREPQKERINSIRIPSPPPCLSAPSGRALMSSSESILPQFSLLRSLSEPQTPECHIVWASARPPWDLPPRRAERAPRGPKTAHESPETPGERSTAPAESKPTPPRTSKGRRRRKSSRSFPIDWCAEELCSWPTARVKLRKPSTQASVALMLNSVSNVTHNAAISTHSGAPSEMQQVISDRVVCWRAL